jgi:hypothetical protein
VKEHPEYLVPTPEGEQADLELAYLVVDGEVIPMTGDNTVRFSIITASQDSAGEEGTV